jgi:hypothetical protein
LGYCIQKIIYTQNPDAVKTFPSLHQKILDKPGPLAYKKEGILDTVYKILDSEGGFHGNDIRKPSGSKKEIPTGRSL